MKKEARYLVFKFLLIPDTRFCVCWFYFILLHHKTLIWDDCKEKVRWGYSEKNIKLCKNLEKVSLLTMLLLNVTYKVDLKSPTRKKFQCFREWNFLALISKKNFIFSREKPFLMFQEIEHSRKLELSNSKVKALLIFLEM